MAGGEIDAGSQTRAGVVVVTEPDFSANSADNLLRLPL
jgi:hypothetical protein